MSEWSPEKYLLFQKQRTQPAIDLVNRVRDLNPSMVADLGCGPGNSTAVLKSVFPKAEITGFDSSPAMIKKAAAEHPDLKFNLCDVKDLNGEFDLLFSNACLQWVPDHENLILNLISHLTAGGVLAVQIPMNSQAPLYRIIHDVAAESKWDFSSASFETNDVLTPEEYHDILSSCVDSFEIWQTVYHHVLPSHESLLDWVRSTRLRPYLEVLASKEQKKFETLILEQAKSAYPFTKSGEVIFHFKRLFFLARR